MTKDDHTLESVVHILDKLIFRMDAIQGRIGDVTDEVYEIKKLREKWKKDQAKKPIKK